MKKTITILIAGIIVLSGYNAIALDDSRSDLEEKTESISISTPIFKDEGRYTKIDLNEKTSFLMQKGKPVLPVITKIFKFPIGTKIKDIRCTFSELNEQMLAKEIMPAPSPLPLEGNRKYFSRTVKDLETYSSCDLYPKKGWFSYRYGCGLDGDQRVVFVRVDCFPIRYLPAENKIYYTNQLDISIEYEKLVDQPVFGDKYDLVVITPRKFALKSLRLIYHKNNYGIKTFLKTTESIYKKYPGRDKAEQIKYFIKDEIEQSGIKYVLLLGGLNELGSDWHIPVRYSNNFDGLEQSYLTDLYYADIYKYNESSGENEFDDWDSNGNDIFAEFTEESQDIIDFYPDVYIGRLACRYGLEVNIMIHKIINYEKQTYNSSWFKKMVLIAGDTFPYPDDPYCEGELITNRSASYLGHLGFNIEKLWTSLGTLTNESSVINAYSKGAGFIEFAGHGQPWELLTHPPQSGRWINCLILSDMVNLKNNKKLPIVITSACHISKFDVNGSLLPHILEFLKNGFKYFEDKYWFKKYGIPDCWTWWMTRKPAGGCIASVGESGYGWGYVGWYTTEGLSGWICPRFFHAYGNQSKQNLGDAHSQAITDYINIIGGVNDEWGNLDRKTIEGWILFGDPSLKIGGYSI